jgi:hypothetical protein
MDIGTYGAVGCLLLVFFTLAILPLIRKDFLEDEISEKEFREYTKTLKENYEVAYGTAGFCARCTHHGRSASLKIYRNREKRSLLLLHCPTCGAAFQINAGTAGL